MEDTLKQILIELKGLREGQQKLDMRMGSFEKSQSRLEETFDNLGTEMRSNFNHLDSKLEQHKDIFQIVSGEIKGTKVDLEYLSAKSGKHDMQINNLEKKMQS